MKSTGIVRYVDKFGRIVLPIELRKLLDVEDGDAIEFFTENNSIVLQKYEKTCFLCGNHEDLITIDRKCICSKCINALNKKITGK